jgi:hypothetical protein
VEAAAAGALASACGASSSGIRQPTFWSEQDAAITASMAIATWREA